MDSLQFPTEPIISFCKHYIAKLQQSNTTGCIEIQCYLVQGHYKVECKCGYFQNFLIAPEDLTNWKTLPLPKRREPLETIDKVLTLLNSALFETFYEYQGHANIMICHRGKNHQYGFQFCPSIIHGIKFC